MNSDAEVMAEPASDTLDPLRAMLGREPEGIEGVRE